MISLIAGVAMVIAVNLFVFPSSLRWMFSRISQAATFNQHWAIWKLKITQCSRIDCVSTLICPSYRTLLIGFLHVYPTIDNTSRDAISQLFLLKIQIFSNCDSRYIIRIHIINTIALFKKSIIYKQWYLREFRVKKIVRSPFFFF